MIELFRPFGFGKEKGERDEPLPEKNDGLPDSDSKSGLCPRCLKQSSFHVVASTPVTFDGGFSVDPHSGEHTLTHSDQVSVLVCRHCRQGVAVVEEEHKEPADQGSYRIAYKGINWWPLPSAALPDVIPVKIRDVFAEAEKALYAECPRSVAVMARRTVEAITDDLGETAGTLYKRLENLKNAHKLYPALFDWATKVRLVGNVGAHYDPIDDVSMEDAKELVSFTRELLEYLYVLPDKVKTKSGTQ